MLTQEKKDEIKALLVKALDNVFRTAEDAWGPEGVMQVDPQRFEARLDLVGIYNGQEYRTVACPEVLIHAPPTPFFQQSVAVEDKS